MRRMSKALWQKTEKLITAIFEREWWKKPSWNPHQSSVFYCSFHAFNLFLVLILLDDKRWQFHDDSVLPLRQFYFTTLSLNPIASRSILTISGIHSYAVSSSLSRLESERDVFGSRWKQWRENRRREKKKANLILKQSSWNHALIVFHLSSWCIYWKMGSDMLRSLWLNDGLCGRQRQWEEWDLIERDEDSMSVIEIRESISFHFIV